MQGSVALLTTGWLPSRQANGIQSVRMGEAFSKLGLHVTLYYISSPELKDDTIEYYNITVPMRLKSLPRAVLPWRKHFRLERWTSLPMLAHAFLWSGFVAHLASRAKADFYYVREPMIAWWLGHRGFRTVLEVHDISTGMEHVFITAAARQNSIKLVVAVTEHLRADLEKQLQVPSEKLLSLHDGACLDARSRPTTKCEARQRFGLPLDKPLVVYTGRLCPEKGVDVLVRAAPMLQAVEVIIVGGESSERQWLQNVVRQTNAPNVTLLGFKSHSDTLSLQKAADVLVLPHSIKFKHSACYTSPLKLFEYMAAEVPIVASDLPSTTEVLHHGVNGWLVPPDSPAALAQGVRHVLKHNSLASALAQKAAGDSKNYTWEARARRIVECIRP